MLDSQIMIYGQPLAMLVSLAGQGHIKLHHWQKKTPLPRWTFQSKIHSWTRGNIQMGNNFSLKIIILNMLMKDLAL